MKIGLTEVRTGTEVQGLGHGGPGVEQVLTTSHQKPEAIGGWIC